MKYFAKNLIFLREKKGIKQKDAAAELGYKSASRLTNYEKGDAKPGVDDLMLLANYYRVKIDDLLNNDLESFVPGPDDAPGEGVENPVFQRMLVESLEERIQTQKKLIDTLTTSNDKLETKYDKLVTMLKGSYSAKIHQVKPVKKEH